MICHEMFDEAGGVAAADDSGGAFGFTADNFSNDSRSSSVGGVFGVA